MISYPKDKREVDKAYRKYIEGQSCMIGFDCLGDVISHHTETVGSGGSDYSCINLCMKHHNEVHAIGKDTFQERFNLDFDKERIRLLIGYIKLSKAKK